MRSNLYTAGTPSITAVVGGGAVNNGLVLNRGLNHVLSVRVMDRHRRAFNPSDPFQYKAVPRPGEILPQYTLEIHCFDTRVQQDSMPVAKYELFGDEWENRDADDVEDGIVHLQLDSEQIDALLPGFYEMAFRLTGIRMESNGSETVVSDEFLGVNLDGTGRLPVRLDSGILPAPREAVIVEFHKERYDSTRQGAINDFRYLSVAIDAGAERNRRTTTHTIAVYHTRDFQGTLFVEGSLTDNPAEEDWFRIPFNDGQETRVWSNPPEDGHPNTVEAFHFRASVRKFRFLWKPAKVIPGVGDEKNRIQGCISKILLRS